MNTEVELAQTIVVIALFTYPIFAGYVLYRLGKLSTDARRTRGKLQTVADEAGVDISLEAYLEKKKQVRKGNVKKTA